MKFNIPTLIFSLLVLTTFASCYQQERNCTDFKTGKFISETEIEGKKYTSTFERNDSIQVETYEGKIDTREELYRDEVESTLNYLILRKVKRMLEENSRETQKVTSPIDLKVLLESHLSLKELEQQLTLKIGTVILK